MTRRREKGSGSVYEDPQRPGRFIGEVTINGRRRRVSGKDRTEVRSKLRALIAKRETSQEVDDRRVTVAETLATFLDRELPNRTSNGRPLAPGSILNYRYNLGIVADELGSVRLANLSIEDVEAMLDRLANRKDRPFSQASLRKLLSMFASAIAFAERRGKVSRNVARLATIPPQARRTAPRRSLSADQARTLLTALQAPTYTDANGREWETRNGLMFVLSLRLGLRPGEAAGLYWSDLDLGANPTVNVTRAVQRSGSRVSVSDELKTSTSKRTIALPSDLAERLERHKVTQDQEKARANENAKATNVAPLWNDERLVFASETGHVLDPKNVRIQLRRTCRRLGLPEIAPNELRHSCASLLADEGVPHEQIADLLGHVDTRMVDRTYRHRLRPVVDVAATATWAKGYK